MAGSQSPVVTADVVIIATDKLSSPSGAAPGSDDEHPASPTASVRAVAIPTHRDMGRGGDIE